MTLTLLQCAQTYGSIKEVEKQEFSFATAHALVMAKKELQPHAEFYYQKEQELVERYIDRDENGKPMIDGNQIRIHRDKAAKYFKERDDLNNVEVDVTRHTIASISNIKPATLEMLMNVFDFDDGGVSE